MRNFLVAGNWKMHGDAASNRELVAGILEGAAAAENVSLLVCPPFPYLASVASQLEGSSVELGAQNVSEH
ncbi:MAG: triose-phosphate isomerase, partial [Gammaproteobacteria bacterium]|nr:triose-phosphate isomerase [Gammaproteobacteria bacterium]